MENYLDWLERKSMKNDPLLDERVYEFHITVPVKVRLTVGEMMEFDEKVMEYVFGAMVTDIEDGWIQPEDAIYLSKEAGTHGEE